IPRRSSSSSAASPAGFIAPPPDIGSTRTTRGGAAIAPGGFSGVGVLGDGAPAAQPAAATTNATACHRASEETLKGTEPLLAYRRWRSGTRMGCVRFPPMLHPKRRIRPAPLVKGSAEVVDLIDNYS